MTEAGPAPISAVCLLHRGWLSRCFLCDMAWVSPKRFCKAGNALRAPMVLLVSMGDDDDLLSSVSLFIGLLLYIKMGISYIMSNSEETPRRQAR